METLRNEVANPAVLDRNLPELNIARRNRIAAILSANKIAANSHLVGVIFESTAKAGVVVPGMHEKDMLAAGAAAEKGGLIAYDPRPGESICLWATPEQMKAGTATPEHREAAKLSIQAYDGWRVSQWEIEVQEGSDFVMTPVSLMGYDGDKPYRILYEDGQPMLAA